MYEWDRYWWLIFPIGFYLFIAFNRWLGYRHQRDRIDLLKTYAAQGKEPPADLAGAAVNPGPDMAPGDYGPWGYGCGGRWGGWKRGPYWEWRRFFTMGALAVGFGIASYYSHNDGTHDAFFVVAVIMGAMALGSLLFALLSLTFAGRK